MLLKKGERMISQKELRELSELSVQERAFLSLYLAGPQSVEKLNPLFRNLRKAVSDEDAKKSEREFLDQNIERVEEYLSAHPLKSGSLCIFVCDVLDYFKALPLTAPVDDHICLDSSPYIRPLAELADEYENVAVVVADNDCARIFLVSAAMAEQEEKVAGNVKNHVRKGGWSQQRYERRRDKQLLHYAREVVDALKRLDSEATFRRIVFVGGKEVLRIIHEELPQVLQNKVAGVKAENLGRGDNVVNEDIWELFFEEERRSEKRLWNRIRTNMLQGGLGTAGLSEVLETVKIGRADAIAVDRDFTPQGVRCRDCDHLHAEEAAECEACGSTSLYPVDVVNEICELAAQTGCQVEFMDSCPTLKEAGRIGALLRY